MDSIIFLVSVPEKETVEVHYYEIETLVKQLISMGFKKEEIKITIK